MNYSIYFIRHGQTDLNKKRVLQGRSDQPLNEEGRLQAEEAGKKLSDSGITIDEIWSSPLQRATATANIVCGNVDGAALHTDERLLEMDYGPYEGTDLLSPPPEIMEFFSDFVHNPAPEGMESLEHVVQRLGSFLEDLRDELAGSGSESEPDRNILISTHAIAMKGALEYLSPDSEGAYWSTHIANCEIYVTHLENGTYSVPAALSID